MPPVQVLRKNVKNAINAVGDEMAILTQKWIDGEISPIDWELILTDKIKQSHIVAALSGNNGKDLDESQKDRLTEKIKSELGYLDNLRAQYEGDEIGEEELLRRIGMYAQASKLTFENEHRAAKSLTEPPKWERRVLSKDADHCDKCKLHAESGWSKFGSLPPIGDDCQCISNCKCRFEYSTTESKPIAEFSVDVLAQFAFDESKVKRDRGKFAKKAVAKDDEKPKVQKTARELWQESTAPIKAALEKNKAYDVVVEKLKKKLGMENIIPQAPECKRAFKKHVVGQLAEKLNHHPYVDLLKFWNDAFIYTERINCGSDDASVMVASMMVNSWASTSGDHNPLAQAIQSRAAEIFGIKESFSHDMDEVTKIRRDNLIKDHAPVIDSFIKASYENTQKTLKDAGIDSITLYRGMQLPAVHSNDELSDEEVKKIKDEKERIADRKAKLTKIIASVNESIYAIDNPKTPDEKLIGVVKSALSADKESISNLDKAINGDDSIDISAIVKLAKTTLMNKLRTFNDEMERLKLDSTVTHFPPTVNHKDELYLQPLSSFSTSIHTASDFSKAKNSSSLVGLVVACVVPRERIYSTSITGQGCFDEFEFVVTGGEKIPCVSVKDHGGSFFIGTNEESFLSGEKIKEQK